MNSIDKKFKTAANQSSPTGPPIAQLPYGLNWADFWDDMNDWDATDHEKMEWLTALSHVVKGFVDWGTGQDTVQMILAKKFVDSETVTATKTPLDSGNMIKDENNTHRKETTRLNSRKADTNE